MSQTARQGGLEAIRGELREQFDRVATADASSTHVPSGRIRIMVVVGLIAIAIPGAVAAAGALDGDDATISVNGDTVRVNGQPIDCPADETIRDSLGLDPCRVFTKPAPPPRSEQPASGSPYEEGPGR